MVAFFRGKRWVIISRGLAFVLVMLLGLTIHVAYHTFKSDLIVNDDYSAFDGSTPLQSVSWKKIGSEAISVNFTWTDKDYIVSDGKLAVNFVCDWSTDKLEVMVRIRDDEYYGFDCVSLAFGKNGSFPKPMDLGYLLSANNHTYQTATVIASGHCYPLLGSPIKSKIHTCTYLDGYYVFHFQKKQALDEFPLRVHLGWYDHVGVSTPTIYDCSVYVQFGYR